MPSVPKRLIPVKEHFSEDGWLQEKLPACFGEFSGLRKRHELLLMFGHMAIRMRSGGVADFSKACRRLTGMSDYTFKRRYLTELAEWDIVKIADERFFCLFPYKKK